MARITSPIDGFTGPGPAGVHFTNGQAETDNLAVIAYAHRHGYEVEETKPKRAPKPPAPKPAKQPEPTAPVTPPEHPKE